MRILGINFSNDSAAAMIEDGVVIAASQEERFSRIKHDPSFPYKAIEFCLEHAGCGLDEVDNVAFFWNPGIHAQAPSSRLTSVPRHHLEYLYDVPTNLMRYFDGDAVACMDQTLWFESGKKLTINFVTHHLCHAAAAFYTSPYDDAAIVTVDGYGERQATGIFAGRGTRIEQLVSVEFPHSLGSFYAAFTQYLGFRPNSGEGKVMGLASYGGAGEFLDPIRDMVKLTDEGFELDLSYFDFFHDRPRRYNEKLVKLLGPSRAPEAEISQRHMDISFAVQSATEEALLHLASIAAKKTGLKNLVVAGGVGLNCVANGRIARESVFDGCFFYPAAGDAGTSVGAALWVYHEIHGKPRSGSVASEYLGPEWSEDQIVTALDKGCVTYRKMEDVESVAAKMISKGLIIGWFQGRAEFGPRALGNRSILADPRSKEMKNILNSRVKFREEFRPYAPSVVEEACGDYFSCDVPSPFMLRAYATLPGKEQVLPSITHVDGTARVQTVSERANEKYHLLISELGARTGVPVVLNTSFNIRGEPIVHSVEDALKCLFTTDMDALFVGDFLVIKDQSRLADYLHD